MLLGIYKNIEELEDNLCLAEVEAILTVAREKEHRQQVFAAALKGIDLDENNSAGEEHFEIVKARAEARLAGTDAESAEFEFFGLDLETE